jgi:TRAP-type C4-dicarboxylate transport system substrate-binding protein
VLFSTVPITTIEEWNGRKLRVNNRGTGLIAGQLGASAISLSAAEIVPALEQGVIEGVVTDTCWAMGAGLNSVIGHASEWTLGTVAPSPVLINKDALDELPAELRATVIAAFDDLAAEFETRWRERNDDVKKKWQEAGVAYHIVTEAENARLLDERVTAPAIEAWRADMERVGQDADAVLATVPGSGE